MVVCFPGTANEIVEMLWTDSCLAEKLDNCGELVEHSAVEHNLIADNHCSSKHLPNTAKKLIIFVIVILK